MIQPERIRPLNRAPRRGGKCVLYWMQQAQRTELNHALEYAVREGNARGQPVVVGFGLTPSFPDAQPCHYRFMLEGLGEVQTALAARGILFVARLGDPATVALRLAADASLVVTDRGYLRVQEAWRQSVAEGADCPVVQVESDVVVPVEAVSDKEEYSAATLRRKISPLLDRFLVPLPEERPVVDTPARDIAGLDLCDTDGIMAQLALPERARALEFRRGGTTAAKETLQTFIDANLAAYAECRNDPARDLGSMMSAYLHFGQISPLFVALQVRAAPRVRQEAKDAYLEELIVRRELAMNFVHFNPAYDRYDALPEWARQTLSEHRADARPYTYDREQLEQAATHDPYWNAAQQELLLTGRMHGYMRMYWGKKILEWSPDPEQAFATALFLNNTYELDGRDANGFAGVAWCFGKHDRGWPERPVLGKVRYMNANGLRRKFHISAYVERIQTLAKRLGRKPTGLG